LDDLDGLDRSTFCVLLQSPDFARGTAFVDLYTQALSSRRLVAAALLSNCLPDITCKICGVTTSTKAFLFPLDKHWHQCYQPPHNVLCKGRVHALEDGLSLQSKIGIAEPRKAPLQLCHAVVRGRSKTVKRRRVLPQTYDWVERSRANKFS